MSILDYFKPVKTMTSEEVRKFLKENDPRDYTLIDVRQPSEYARGHLPGAQLIPVGELGERLEGLDRARPTIAY